MLEKRRRPAWGQLFLGVPVMIGLFWFVEQQALTETGRTLLQVMMLLLVYGGVSLWLKANAVAMLEEDVQRSREERQRGPDAAPARRSENVENPRPSRPRPALKQRLAGWAALVGGLFH